MTFHIRHAWHVGAVVNGAQLATCAQCECLRVELAGDSYFIRRVVDVAEEATRASTVAGLEARGEHVSPGGGEPSDDAGARVRRVEPPCVSPAVGFHPPW